MNVPSKLLISLTLLLGTAPVQAAPNPAAITFESDRVGQAPQGFIFERTGEGRKGRWLVQSVPDAPSGKNVLTQVGDDPTDYRFPIAVASQPTVKDAQVMVRCKPIAGKIDQACGLVFRYQDAANYYVARANALEDNVNLYRVTSGHRQQIAGWRGKVSGKAWHTLRADASGDHFEIYWDGKKVLDAHDGTFSQAGKVGLWTKADSLTSFDDLQILPLRSAP